MSTKARRYQKVSVVAFVVLTGAFALSVLGREDERRERTVATGATVRRSDPAGFGRLVAPIVRTPRDPRVSLAPASVSDKTLLAAPTASLAVSGATTPDGEGSTPVRVASTGAEAVSNDESASDESATDDEEGLVAPSVVRPKHVVLITRGKLVALVARGLAAEDTDSRIDALRVIRENGVVEVGATVVRLALEDRDADVRRHASQVLALGDAEAHRAVLERLATDHDLGVRVNAAFGLARLGDTAAEARLVSLLEEARRGDSPFVDSIEAALASKDLDGSVVIAAHRRHDPRNDPRHDNR